MSGRRRAGRPPTRSGALDRELKTRIDRELHERVKATAAREERSEAAIVRRAIRRYLEEVGA